MALPTDSLFLQHAANYELMLQLCKNVQSTTRLGANAWRSFLHGREMDASRYGRAGDWPAWKSGKKEMTEEAFWNHKPFVKALRGG